MNRFLLLPFLLVLAGCSGETSELASTDPHVAAANNRDAQPDPLDDSDCNLQTVLDPNKPGSPGHLIKSDRNPNGDSELAVLMRLFVDDLRDARVLVEAGQAVKPLFPVHRNMRCAWPTIPAERDEGYDARAQSYLAIVRGFDAAPSKGSYNVIINSCVACHQVSCGGVIEFIESLRWE
ncbi:MAG TPA: hypothetical protein EYP98_13220 [Planctomycetes bacterium]|nr:hypothetical protein [Planctomycetota bacterium]